MISYPNIDPVALKIGPLAVHWYGIMYLIGFFSAWRLGLHRCRTSKGEWREEIMSDLIFYCSLGVIFGGRLGYVIFYDLKYFFLNPIKIFAVWDGGMSFHGGFIGVIIAFYFFGKKINKSFFQMADFIAPLGPLGLAAGRFGNFINGELWGRVTTHNWAMIFPKDPLKLPRHPSQLYEFFLEGIVLFVIIWLFSGKKRPKSAVSAVFLIGYGFFRFIVEFFREPDSQIGYAAFNWMTRGQELSLPMLIIGIILLFFAYRKKQI